MKPWLAVLACLLGGCMWYDLVQPKPEPTGVGIHVSSQHDTVTVTWTSIVIEPGIDETGDFRRVPMEPGVVDGRAIQPQLASNGRMVFYGMVDTSALAIAPRMMTIAVPAFSTPRFNATVRVPIVASPDSGRTTLRGTDDLRLRIAYPPELIESDYELASWSLRLNTTSCNSGEGVLTLNGLGLAPAELRVPRSLISTEGASSMAACLRVAFAHAERTETVSLFVSSYANVAWEVTIEP